jgi:hypothetical protein
MALYCFEDSFFGLVPCCAFSDSWHISFPLIDFVFSGCWRQLISSREANPLNQLTDQAAICNTRKMGPFTTYDYFTFFRLPNVSH